MMVVARYVSTDVFMCAVGLCNPRMRVTVADLIIAMANDVILAIVVALHTAGRFMGSGSLLVV